MQVNQYDWCTATRYNQWLRSYWSAIRAMTVKKYKKCLKKSDHQ